MTEITPPQSQLTHPSVRPSSYTLFSLSGQEDRLDPDRQAFCPKVRRLSSRVLDAVDGRRGGAGRVGAAHQPQHRRQLHLQQRVQVLTGCHRTKAG